MGSGINNLEEFSEKFNNNIARKGSTAYSIYNNDDDGYLLEVMKNRLISLGFSEEQVNNLSTAKEAFSFMQTSGVVHSSVTFDRYTKPFLTERKPNDMKDFSIDTYSLGNQKMTTALKNQAGNSLNVTTKDLIERAGIEDFFVNDNDYAELVLPEYASADY